jgi:UDP-N-acetylglucosamine 4,6-dehydratase
MLKGKVLITGGTGSFGSTIVHDLLKAPQVSEVRIFSRDEKKQDDLRKNLRNGKVKFYLGDVRDTHSVKNAVKGVDFVFHAAALKQVPSCDFFPLEAVKTNILGTSNVLTACKEFSDTVKKVVVLSTDKAVAPINAMGMSKALMEKVMIAESRNCEDHQVFCGTRYGNVIASRGSVIPLFIKQVKEDGRITITDPNMTRFLMSLDDASNLVKFAFNNGSNGDIFVQKSPAATVETIAKAVIKLLGKSEQDVEMSIIGTRHGEKKHESLIGQEDLPIAEDLGEYFRIPSDSRSLNYENYVEMGKAIDRSQTYSSNGVYIMDVSETSSLLARNKQVQEYLR